MNSAAAALARGGIAVGTWVHLLSSAPGTALLASEGLDFLYIDMQHSPFTEDTVCDLVVGARLGGSVPVVRPPTKDYPVGRLLDIGAMGILVPGVTSAEDVTRVVDAAKYAPVGRRPIRSDPVEAAARRSSGDDGRDEAMVVIQIESALALDRLDSILAVPGIDVAVVGRSDLSHDLGVPNEVEHPSVVAAVERVIEACAVHGVVPGLLVPDSASALTWIGRGIRWVPVGSDDRLLSQGIRATMAELAGARR